LQILKEGLCHLKKANIRPAVKIHDTRSLWKHIVSCY